MLNLPTPIDRYFRTETTNPDAIALCFAENATVLDEGQTHIGRDAIKQWVLNSASQYSFTTEPFAVEQMGDRVIVTSKVSGTFPGSPIDLRYTFGLNGDEIESLEIGL